MREYTAQNASLLIGGKLKETEVTKCDSRSCRGLHTNVSLGVCQFVTRPVGIALV